MTVVIFSFADDIHARAVEWALEDRGVRCRVISQADFPQRITASLWFGREDKATVQESEDDEPISQADVVWHRRVGPLVLPADAHPSDLHAIEQQGTLFLRWLRASVFPTSFWINDVEAHARGSNKLLQLRHATAAGFNVADTLVSNTPGDIRAFLRQPGEFIAKPLSPLNWHSAETSSSSYTAEVSAADCQPDEAVQWLPMIYQRKIDKLFELRVVVMGRSIFAAKINSQELSAASLDWRAAQQDPALRYELFHLSDTLRAVIFRFMDSMGLVFGSLDLIVSPDGEIWFLEINEQGQFLFLELGIPAMPLLDAFAQFCTNGHAEFSYVEPESPVRFSSFVKSDHWAVDHPKRMEMHLLHAPRVSEKE